MVSCGRLTELLERERIGQRRAGSDLVEIVVRAADADDSQSGLNRAQLADECLPALLEEMAGDDDIDADPAQDLERLERILGAEDAMAGLAERLVDQLLHGCVLLEYEDRHGNHAATLKGGERLR